VTHVFLGESLQRDVFTDADELLVDHTASRFARGWVAANVSGCA
jgi:hypothetical protein